MITSFFGKSKPVHFLILGGFIAFAFIWTLFKEYSEALEVSTVIYNIALIVITVLSVILLDFIVSKNHLTRRNAYAIFFYSCFLVMLPNVFLNLDILWANFFLLLALRRIISLRKDTNSEKKILDTAIWTTVAALFYFWSLLFFIPLWFAIIQKPNLTYKELLIPIIGFFAVLIIHTSYQLIVNENFEWFFQLIEPINLDFSLYNSLDVLIPASIILTLLIFTWLFRLRSLASISLKEKANYMVFLIIVITTLVIAVFGPTKNGSEMIFIFAPTSILCANYIEGLEKPRYQKNDMSEFWFKEILLWMVLSIAIIFLFL